jgi:hypothetical protein
MSAFGGKADKTIVACPLLWSLLGVKRTCSVALHMSAFDPRRTFVQYGSSPFFLAQGDDHVATGRLGPNTGWRTHAARPCMSGIGILIGARWNLHPLSARPVWCRQTRAERWIRPLPMIQCGPLPIQHSSMVPLSWPRPHCMQSYMGSPPAYVRGAADDAQSPMEKRTHPVCGGALTVMRPRLPSSSSPCSSSLP